MKSIACIQLFLLFVFSPFVFADDAHKGYCKDAESTADLIACIGNHFNNSNKEITKVYDLIQVAYEGDDVFLEKLGTHHENWLTYRNDICEIESDLYAGGSLSRVQALSCQARVTTNYLDHLYAVLNAKDEDYVSEFSVEPRWINVLRSDYDDVFWQIGSVQAVDIDCDGQDERLVQGLKTKNVSGIEALLAIIDSKHTGRPMASVLDFDSEKKCEILSVNVSNRLPLEKPIEGELKECVQDVEVNTASCGDFVLTHTGGQYNLGKKDINGN